MKTPTNQLKKHKRLDSLPSKKEIRKVITETVELYEDEKLDLVEAISKMIGRHK